MSWAIGLAVVVLLVAGIRVLARWAGRRGWVYNKHNPRPPGSGSPMLLEQIYQPSIQHVAEEQASERIRADQAESGQDEDPDGAAS